MFPSFISLIKVLLPPVDDYAFVFVNYALNLSASIIPEYPSLYALEPGSVFNSKLFYFLVHRFHTANAIQYH